MRRRAAIGTTDLDALKREREAPGAGVQGACEGVSPGDIAPGVAGLDVVRVAVLERPVRYMEDVVEGAAAVIRTPGRSFESTNLLMRCRAARAAIIRDPADPLAVPGASVRVYRDDGESVIVQIRSKRDDSAHEIVRRLRSQARGADDMSMLDDDQSPGNAGTGGTAALPPPPRSSGTLVPPKVGPARPTFWP